MVAIIMANAKPINVNDNIVIYYNYRELTPTNKDVNDKRFSSISKTHEIHP